MERRKVEEPWSDVSADLMEFPQSKSRNKYLIVFEDLFKRWVEVKSAPNAMGIAVQKPLEDLVVFRWGTPRRLIVDNGSKFDNKWIAEMVKSYGIELVSTPPYHHRANPTEQCHRTLKPMIAMNQQGNHKEWDLHVHELRNAINTAGHASTKFSPAFLNFGRHPLPPSSLRREVEQGREIEATTVEEWREKMRRLENVRDLVRNHNE